MTSAPREPLNLTEEALDEALRGGLEEAHLRAEFGDPLYEELRDLAQMVETRQRQGTRSRGQVFVLPGIMGSKLSVREDDGDRDLLWLNPFAIRRGRMPELAWPSDNVEPTGIFHFAYQRMRLRLMLKGFSVRHLPYDWRAGPAASAEMLWPEISRARGEVSLICHSMGGLVARALAARDTGRRIKRVITLGTPNFGSYEPVTVMRGVHRYVQLLARIAPKMGPKELVSRILRHYPGLLELLPAPEQRPDQRFFEAGYWPEGSHVPGAEVLSAAGVAQAALPLPDKRFTQIIGLGHQTIESLRLDGGDMVFLRSDDGDGTVPRALAEMDGAGQRFYVTGKHGSLCNMRGVIDACADVLNGLVPELPRSHTDLRSRSDKGVEIRERDLAIEERAGLPRSGDPARSPIPDSMILDRFLSGAADVDAQERADLVQDQAATEPAAPQGAYVYTHQAQSLRRINVDVMQANLLDVPADAYVLGIFEGVTVLGGALGAVDGALDGMLSALLADGQITGRRGEITFIPIPQHHLRTSHVVVVGLGPLGPETTIEAAVHVAGRNLMRALCISNVSSFAAVLLGAGSGPDALSIFRKLFKGMFEALEDWDRDQSFSRIKICEMDPERYDEIVDSLNSAFARFNMTNCEIVVQEQPAPAWARGRVASGRKRALMPDILTARADLSEEDTGDPLVTLSVHHVPGSSKSRASLTHRSKSFRLSELDAVTAPLGQALPAGQLRDVADQIEALVLHPLLRDNLHFDHDAGNGLQIVCDAWSARVPWEVLHLNGPAIALTGGISRWYLPASGGVRRAARRSAERRARVLRMLLVSNPTLDLPGAEAEAGFVYDLLARHRDFEVAHLDGTRASLDRVRNALSLSDRDRLYDLFHYAGHAFFDDQDRAQSGLQLSGHHVLRGTEIANLPHVPGMVFLNACESVRVRSAARGAAAQARGQDFAAQTTGLAEAFLLAGVRHILGTFWPVGDRAAQEFASTFYSAVQDRAMGAALQQARRALDRDGQGTAEWVNYVHYGAPSDRL